MKGYLSPKQDGTGTIPIETVTEIYRNPDAGQEIVVATNGSESSLGIADATVSRKKGDGAPIVLKPESECIEVRNENNSNGIVIRTEGDRKEIEQGFSARVRRDAVLQIGYQTDLQLKIERAAREEYVINGSIDTNGDIVMGDQRNVDSRTSVEDVVAKELNVDGENPADISDAVANEINVGADEPDQSDTRNFCSEHERYYAGQECPECNESQRSAVATQDSKYCLYCGEEIPKIASICPECDQTLPKPSGES